MYKGKGKGEKEGGVGKVHLLRVLTLGAPAVIVRVVGEGAA